jgi:hypothetical protein
VGDFPTHFIDNYIHWLNLSTGELEFRPVGSPWTPEPSNWRLYIHRSGVTSPNPRAMLRKASEDDSSTRLIDIRSSTFVAVSNLLASLESPEHIVATHTTRKLDISLPRFHLSFIVNANWELECCSIPGYIVDNTQSFGTMFGLRTKLVLCPSPSGSGEPLRPRRVIIPQGDISFSTNGDFANVSINTNAGQHVIWHEYTVDTDLGCLTSNTSLSSKLYQCYLHALTSFCLPDPLLGHTGTEEALYILRSATCRSFQRLDVQEAKLLESIGELSPSIVRSSRATLKWCHLPALSQHHDFFGFARSILDHACTLEALYDPPTTFNTSSRDQTPLRRAACRNKLYYSSDLHTAEQLSSQDDIKYMSGGVYGPESSEHLAFRTSWSLWNAQPSLEHTSPNLWDLMKHWNSLGPASSEISLQYSRYWLQFYAPRDWLMICDLIRKSAKRNLRNLRIELSFSLSAAAYSRSIHPNLILFMIIFVLNERCRNLSPPPNLSYALVDGLAPELTRLEKIVFECALPISPTSVNSVEVGGTRRQNTKFWQKRKHESTSEKSYDPAYVAEYQATIRRESLTLANLILHRWPDHKSVDPPEQWFNRSECNRRIEEYFQSISWNIRLEEHVLQVQSIMRQYEGTSISAGVPYVFSPQFITGHSQLPLYSLCDIFSSRINAPTPVALEGPSICRAILRTEEKASESPQAISESLEILIKEIRHSPNPLLQLYGNELGNSHRELWGKNAPQYARDALPSHEAILLYHKECSHRKDKFFSELSAALAPFLIVEEISHIAGLWPRITPRSMLRQLAHDRIGTLPEGWKLAITCYAVCFLVYKQSLRLLELSSRRQHEELIREIEAIRYDILSESSPDWLLIQVRPLPC